MLVFCGYIVIGRGDYLVGSKERNAFFFQHIKSLRAGYLVYEVFVNVEYVRTMLY